MICEESIMKITYREESGIFYPNLEMPKQTNHPIGKYGKMRLDFCLSIGVGLTPRS